MWAFFPSETIISMEASTFVERHPKIAEVLHDLYDPTRFCHHLEKSWKIKNIRFKKGLLVLLLIRDWGDKGDVETVVLIGDEIPEDMALQCRKILMSDYEHIRKQIVSLQQYLKTNDLN